MPVHRKTSAPQVWQLSSSKKISIDAIKNPNQIDAHQYSKKVLVGSDFSTKTSPKFERAKSVSQYLTGQIYISGTAAILGQNSTEKQDVGTQTEITIDNILKLISIDNLKSNNISILDKKITISYLRVYVKYEKDIQIVKNICKQYFPNIMIIFVKADICRDDLLVEIEGIAGY